jgi:hypothetical protein
MELTTAEAGAAIAVSDETIRNHIAAGRLLARKHGFRGLLKIKIDDLRAFAHKHNYIVDEEYLAGLKQTAS